MHFFKKFKFFIFFFIFIFALGDLKASNTSIGKNTQDKNNTSFIKKNKISNLSPYLLDSGDVVTIKFNGIDIFSGNYVIDLDGFLLLPDLGTFYVRGNSIEELITILNMRYEEYIKDPDILINLYSPRPVKFLVKGEVKRPGLYTLTYVAKATNGPVTVSQPMILNAPSVFEALKLSGGLRLSADLSNIIVIRENSKSLGGGKIKTTLDFLSLLDSGDQNQNITLRDGDTIIVSRSDTPISKQVIQAFRTNINPESIKVFINGNVLSQGAQAIPLNSSLNEAIAIAGGRRLSSGNIEFIRFDDLGTLTKRNISYNIKSPKGSKNNPVLMDGDMIVVRQNIIGKTATTLGEVGRPIFSGYGLYRLIF